MGSEKEEGGREEGEKREREAVQWSRDANTTVQYLHTMYTRPRPLHTSSPVHKHDDCAVLVLPLFQDWPEQIDLLTSSRVPHHISTPPLLPHSHDL